jgi:tight adherence protein B
MASTVSGPTLSGVTAVAVVAIVLAAQAARDALLSRRVRGRFGQTGSSWRMPQLVAPVLDRGLRGRRGRAIDQGLPAWLDGAARAARSGASLRHALVDGASIVQGERVGSYLAPYAEQLNRGTPLVAVLDDLADRDASASRDLVWRALRLAGNIGGPSTTVLDAVASTLHERAALAREVRALSTQARASAAVMVAAPAVFAIGAVSADPRVAQFFGSAPGLACVVAGVTLDAVGALWMARLVRVVS